MRTSSLLIACAIGAQGDAAADQAQFEKLRIAKGHLLEDASFEDMQHLNDHIGKNGLAFGGFFAKDATDLVEDFKALAADQKSFHSDMDHKVWNFRLTHDLSIAEKMGWCHNGQHKPAKADPADTEKKPDDHYDSKPYKSCIVMLKSAKEEDMVMSHNVFDKDKESLLKEIKDLVARNMAETPDAALYESETL